MVRDVTRLKVVVIAVILLVGLGLLGKYVLWPERPDTDAVKQLDVTLNLEGVELSQGRDGRKIWALRAAGADYAEVGNELILTAPVITYWSKDETPVLVTAPKGQVWQKEDRAKMWDGVNATRGEYLLRSQTLDYLGAEQELVLAGDVDLTGQNMQARSDTMTYFLQSDEILAVGNVRVLLN
jgi:LPS export ABC transporter protein LptC